MGWPLPAKKSLTSATTLLLEMKKEFDRHDILILSALNDDPRMPVSELGELVHLSRTAASRRLMALRDSSVFEEHPQLIEFSALGYETRAFVEIYPADKPKDQVKKLLLGRPEVIRISVVSGKALYLVEVVAANMGHLDSLMQWAQSLGDTETRVVFSDTRSDVSLNRRLDALEKYRARAGLPAQQRKLRQLTSGE